MNKEPISFDDFKKCDIRIGTVLSAEAVEGADKLLKLSVDVGEGEPRQIVSGIREYVEPDAIVGKQYPFVLNIPKREIRGVESHGMILTVSNEEGISLMSPENNVSPGSMIS